MKMTTPVRAIYENGHLRLLDPVEPQVGETITVQIVEEPAAGPPVRKKRVPNLFPGMEASDDFDAELPDSFWLGES
jgi:predicted DNA-binding antitoxin AbrB/MazE fold protein